MPGLFGSLRFRIALAFVVWTAVILLIVTVVLPPVREVFALKSVDAGLAAPARDMAAALAGASDFPPDLTSWTSEPSYQEWGGERLFFELRDGQGAVVAASANLEGSTLPFNPKALLGAHGGAVFTTATAATMPAIRSGGATPEEPARARVITVPVRRADDGKVYYLQAARSLAGMDQTRDVFYIILIVVTTAATLAAGVAGWIVAGRVSSRLEQIAVSVRRISPMNLDERLDVRTLPAEIGRLAADVNVMLERLAQGFRSQERFISDVSHELKTPVAVLLTEAQALKMTRQGDEGHKAFVLSVEDEMRRLGKLVESFLMLARFGHGRRFIGEVVFSVNDVALDSVQHSKLLAAQHGVALSLSLYDAGSEGEDPTVRGDPDLVRIVIDNLIRNAIQYSNRGDTVRVEVVREGGHVTISVQDKGRGVPEEYLNTIFDRFAQAPVPTPSGRRGTGLGLAIAKGVVDLHRGSISVRNRSEGGCVFTVSLPLDLAAQGGSGEAEVGASRLTVLGNGHVAPSQAGTPAAPPAVRAPLPSG